MINEEMKETQDKYTELIISMSLDYLQGKITFEHYTNTLKLCTEKMDDLK